MIGTVLFASCSIGLEPASSAARSSFTIRVGTAASSTRNVAERALATNSGFLYAQTGTDPETAVLYGPYAIDEHSSVTVTDIPAGTYAPLLLVYVPTLPENGFATIYPPDGSSESVRLAVQSRLSDEALKRTSSCAIVERFTLRAGSRNSLSATFVPTTDFAYSNESLPLMGSLTEVSRRFIKIDGVKSHFATAGTSMLKKMRFDLSYEYGQSVSLTSFALYNSAGTSVYRDVSAHMINNDKKFSVEVPWSGDDAYYVFVESVADELVLNVQYTMTPDNVDSTPPVFSSLQICDPDTNALYPYTYTKSQVVTLKLACIETGSGISGIQISGAELLSDALFFYDGEPVEILSRTGTAITLKAPLVDSSKYIEITGVSLSSDNGLKEVSVVLSDAAGNASAALTATTTLDTEPPTITVNLGANTDCNGTIVDGSYVYVRAGGTLTYSITDNYGIEGNPIFADVTGNPYTVSGNTISLPSNGGSLVISARDKAGNIRTMTINLIVDTNGPTVSEATTDATSVSFTVGFSGSPCVKYSVYQTTAIETGSVTDLDKLELSSFILDDTCAAGGKSVSGLFSLTAAGYHYVKFIMYDRIGNVSTYVIERQYNGTSYTCTIK